MRIVLLGAPGSGKGTQARLLAERYRVPRISTGDLLREAVAAGTETGRKAKKKLGAGELVPDAVAIEVIAERLRARDARKGFLLDGFPRNIPQAQELDQMLSMLSQPVQIALLIDADPESLLKRITGRRYCEKCGAIYNIHTFPPAKRGLCDVCGGKLAARPGDRERTARRRLEVYREQTEPLVTYYRAQHKLRTVKARGGIPEIQEKICEIIDLEIRPLEIKTLETAAETLDEETSTIIAGGKVTKITATQPGKPAPAAPTEKGGGSSAPEKKRAARKTAAKKKSAKTTKPVKAAGKPKAKKSAAKSSGSNAPGSQGAGSGRNSGKGK